jgi:hypothetical protein
LFIKDRIFPNENFKNITFAVFSCGTQGHNQF